MTIQDAPRRLDPKPGIIGLTGRDELLHSRDPAAPLHTETAVEARQGWLDRPMLVVLIAGLILAALFVIGMNIWSGAEDLPPAGQIDDTPAAVEEAPAPVVPVEPAG